VWLNFAPITPTLGEGSPDVHVTHSGDQSRDRAMPIGELLAILYAAKIAPRNTLLRARSDSKFAIDGLTKHTKNGRRKTGLE
jgi:hypothetical protein